MFERTSVCGWDDTYLCSQTHAMQMINEGSWHDYMWPDQWVQSCGSCGGELVVVLCLSILKRVLTTCTFPQTCTTEDGKRSAQFEETILITDTGCEVLTKGSYVPEGAQI